MNETTSSSLMEQQNEIMKEMMRMTDGKKNRKKNVEFNELPRQLRENLRTLRMPNQIDKIRQMKPCPYEFVPQNGLPRMTKQPLDFKLFMIPYPENSILLSREKYGTQLRKKIKQKNFDLTDLESIEYYFPYEDLHDPQLICRHKCKDVKNFLLSMGYIDENNNVLCSVKQFNNFRRYINQLYSTLVRKNVKIMAAEKADEKNVNNIKELTNRRNEKKAHIHFLQEAGATKREQHRAEREAYKERLIFTTKEKNERYFKIMEQREKDKLLRKIRGEELRRISQVKANFEKDVRRTRKSRILRKINEAETRRRRRMKKEAEERERMKKEKVYNRWYSKIQYQLEKMKEEEEMIRQYEETHEKNIQIWNELSKENEKRRLEQRAKIRQQSLNERREAKIKRNYQELLSNIKKIWFKTHKNNRVEQYRVNKSFNATVAELTHIPGAGPDLYSLILHTRQRMEYESKIPEQVSVALDSLLEGTILEFTKQRLSYVYEGTIIQLTEHCQERLKEIRKRFQYKSAEEIISEHGNKKKVLKINEEVSEGDKKADGSAGSMSRTENNEDISNKDAVSECVKKKTQTKKSRIGDVVYHEIPDFEEADLKPVSKKAATIMPSLNTLTTLGFKETNLNDLLADTFVKGNKITENSKLLITLAHLGRKLLKEAEKWTESVLEPQTRAKLQHRLAHIGDYTHEEVTEKLGHFVLNIDEKNWLQEKEFVWFAKVIAKEAIRRVLHPPLFEKPINPEITRRKVLWFKSKILEYID